MTTTADPAAPAASWWWTTNPTSAASCAGTSGGRVRGRRSRDRGPGPRRVGSVDLVLLDIGLPDGNGLDLLRDLRSVSPVYVILVTARAEESRSVDRPRGRGGRLRGQGPSAPARSPPASAPSCAARVRRGRSARRRSRSTDSPWTSGPGRSPSTGRRSRSPRSSSTCWPPWRPPPGQVFTRRQLLDAVWEDGHFGDERVVDVHIRGLRRALADDPAAPGSSPRSGRGLQGPPARGPRGRDDPHPAGPPVPLAPRGGETGVVVVLVVVRLTAPTALRRLLRPGGPGGRRAGAGAGLRSVVADAVTTATVWGALAGVAVALLSRPGWWAPAPLPRRGRRRHHGDRRRLHPSDQPAPGREIAALADGGVSTLARAHRRDRGAPDCLHRRGRPRDAHAADRDRRVRGGISDGVFGVEELGHVRAESSRLRRLSEDLSTLSRASEGRLELAPTETDLNELVGGTVERLRPGSAGRGSSCGWTRRAER